MIGYVNVGRLCVVKIGVAPASGFLGGGDDTLPRWPLRSFFFFFYFYFYDFNDSFSFFFSLVIWGFRGVEVLGYRLGSEFWGDILLACTNESRRPESIHLKPFLPASFV